MTDSNVIVFVLTTDNKSERVKNVMNIFSDKSFTVIPTTLSDAKGAASASEYTRFIRCLEVAERDYPSQNCIIVKDNSLTFSSPQYIAKVINSVSATGGWDLFYPCKWLDNCNLYSSKPLTRDVIIAKAQAPQGLQAVMVSPTGRAKILKLAHDPSKSFSQTITDAVAASKLEAYTLPRSIIHVDPMTIDGQWYKYNDCKDGSGGGGMSGANGVGVGTMTRTTDGKRTVVVKKDNSGNNKGMLQNMTLWWLVIAVIVALIVGWWWKKRRTEGGEMGEATGYG